MSIRGYGESLVGKRFGKLSILSASQFIGRVRLATCKCDCGKTSEHRVALLVRGNTKSCGCLKKEHNKAYFTTHGCTKTPLYQVWLNIRDRCFNKKCKAYPSYGGRGISICNEWNDFQAFQKWAMDNGYQKGLTVERVNNNDGYSPGNCVFATRSIQNNNKRNNVIIEYNGEKLNLAQWAKKLGVNREMIKYRFNAGWSPEDILTKPSSKAA